MAKLTKVRFVRSTRPGECDEPIPAGTETQLSEDSLNRWLRRGAVEEIEDSKPATETKTQNTKKVK